MVEIKFAESVDSEREYVSVDDFDAGLPDNIEKVDINFDEEQSDNEDETALDLSDLENMMNRTARKIGIIVFKRVNQLSPEFLARFVSLSNKTFGLGFSDCVLNGPLHGCLMASIMNGLKRLEIVDFTPTEYQSKLLFEAVGSSSTLEHLDLRGELVLNDEICSSLMQALRRNCRLRHLNLAQDKISAPGELFRTALCESALEEFSVDTDSEEQPYLPLSILIEGLCREECKMKMMALSYQYSIDLDLNDVSMHNTSLVELRLNYSNLTCHQIVKIARTCKSLELLDISHTPTSDLTPLDEILLGENTVLNSLLLENIGLLTKAKWMEFFRKIPKMKSLRYLVISHEIFLHYGSLRDVFLDALWQNTILETCMLEPDVWDWNAMDLYKNFFPKVYFPLCLNRAGRTALRNVPSEQPLHLGLWPQILERSMELTYSDSTGIAEHAENCNTCTATCNDAVYWLLRENLFV